MWIIELELPSGHFYARREDNPKPIEELDAEIRSSDLLLLAQPDLSPGPSRLNEEDVATKPENPQSHRLMLAYHGLESVAVAVVETLARTFDKPQPPWTLKQLAILSEILRKAYAHR